jgi:Flp pilus assembly protein TadD
MTVEQAHQQAITFYQNGQLQDAERLYRAILQVYPRDPDANHNLGSLLQDTNRLLEAEAAYHRAIECRPNFLEAFNNLSTMLEKANRLPEAEAACRCALELKPDSAVILYNLGIILKKTNHLFEAEKVYRQAIELQSDMIEAHNNLGSLLHENDRLHEAETTYLHAITLKPAHVEAHNNLGSLLYDTNRLLEAEQVYRHAIELKPDFADAHCNLAFTLLKLGDLKAGWEEYEWRWATPQMLGARRDFTQPQWHGEAAEGKTLLIHLEGGFGDTLQFCRYAQLAIARGLRVILEVQPELVRLLQCLPGVDRVVRAGEEVPAFDLHCSMLSLPLAFETDLATIPRATSYLNADKAQVDAWRIRLADLSNKNFRIGLAWAGNPRSHFSRLAAVDRRRSIAPELLAPLFNLPGFHFFSLQKDRAVAPENFLLTDFMGEMKEFADTAALIANLDLVISVDTSVAHLAAALGKPVWVLDRFDSCWRWLHDREDSPWYPTVRLFRQPQPGDWHAVIEKVVEELPYWHRESLCNEIATPNIDN